MAYLDSDPVFTQAKLARGERKFTARVLAHDVHFSFGECLSSAIIPATPYKWLPTRQPIVLAEWPQSPARRNVLTTVMSWTSYPPVSHAGRTYSQKDVEFLRLIELPGVVQDLDLQLEVALNDTEHLDWETNGTVGRSGRSVSNTLKAAGWRVVAAEETCGSLESYQDYIATSMGEWSVAKNGYVVGRCGWFSCRSACYLASGKPVVLQDTGFGSILPIGYGLLTFANLHEAAAAVRDVAASYPRHAKAAREIAEAYFDSDKVLRHLIDVAMSAERHELTRGGGKVGVRSPSVRHS
jgi:hypothetical protein